MFEAFASRSTQCPDAPFIIEPDGSVLTYGVAAELVGRMAAAFAATGVKIGDRIAVQVDKSPLALLTYLAALRIGAVYLPLNTAYTMSEVRYFLEDAAPALFLCRPEDEAAASRLCAEVHVPACKSLGPDGGSFNDTLSATREAAEPVASDPGRLAAILYTSGTTGRSKGAMLSNANLSSNAQVLCSQWQFTAADRLLHALPIFHTHGLFVATNVTICAGSAMVLLPRFSADAVIDALPRSTVMMGVPTFYTRLLERPDFTRDRTGHMRLFISGSAPLSPETHRQFAERTGHAILERYGMTETNMITSNPYTGDRVPSSVGMALPGVEVRICDRDTGAELDAGAFGVIEVRGPNVFGGYWNNAEKTAEAFRDDGFFVTGDLGYRDASGYVFIMGRANDLIISGGYNIYPAEVEIALDSIPGVEESAVIGVAHPDLGEAAIALVKRSDPGLTEAAMLAAIHDELARFKHPRKIIFVDELPRNAMAKVQKAQLRATYAAAFTAA